MLAFTPLGQLEGIVQDAVETVSAEYGLLQYHFPIRAAELAAADIRVLAFGILARHQKIYIARLVVGLRAGDGRHQWSGTQGDGLVEGTAGAQGTPGISRTGRRLMYWSKSRRKRSSDPHSDTWSGTTSGQPTAPNRIASNPFRRSYQSGGIISPCCK